MKRHLQIRVIQAQSSCFINTTGKPINQNLTHLIFNRLSNTPKLSFMCFRRLIFKQSNIVCILSIAHLIQTFFWIFFCVNERRIRVTNFVNVADGSVFNCFKHWMMAMSLSLYDGKCERRCDKITFWETFVILYCRLLGRPIKFQSLQRLVFSTHILIVAECFHQAAAKKDAIK